MDASPIERGVLGEDTGFLKRDVLDATEGNQYFAIRSFGMLERTGDDKGRFEIKRSLREVEPGAKGGPGLAWPSGLPYRTAHLPDFRRRRLVA